jgi:hypothetical protein
VAEPNVAEERIIAVGLLTHRELMLLGPDFDRAWPVDKTPCFGELLRAVDEADLDVTSDRRETCDT